jgi:hypothetical protein
MGTLLPPHPVGVSRRWSLLLDISKQLTRPLLTALAALLLGPRLSRQWSRLFGDHDKRVFKATGTGRLPMFPNCLELCRVG